MPRRRTLAGTIYVVWLLPDALLRFGLWLLTRTLYRVRVLGRDNIPGKGGALFVCNHVSFVDALLLIASTDRHVRFVMFAGIYELPWVKPFARILGAIPISSAQRPRDLLKALQTASEAIRAGDVVCIFAEGQITRIGQLLPFRRGMEQIMKDVDAPIVPVALDGVWGSIFSFEKRRFVWKLPRRIPYPITVSFGAPMPPRATASEVRQAVQELLASAWSLSPRADAAAAPGLRALGAAASVPLCHGRLAVAQSEFWFGADENDLSGAAIETGLGRAENGRAAPAALGAGRAGEFRGDVARQSAGEPELHALGRNPSLPASASAKSKPS